MVFTRRICFLTIFCLSFLLSACGYQIQGLHTPVASSVMGDGTKTVRIDRVEENTLYPWLPSFIRSKVRDEITLRKLAVWADSLDAGETVDYTMTIRVPSFQVRSDTSDQTGQTLLSAATAFMEIILYDGKTGEEVWRSGMVAYSGKYTSVRESIAIQEIVQETVYRSIDRLQQAF